MQHFATSASPGNCDASDEETLCIAGPESGRSLPFRRSLCVVVASGTLLVGGLFMFARAVAGGQHPRMKGLVVVKRLGGSTNLNSDAGLLLDDMDDAGYKFNEDTENSREPSSTRERVDDFDDMGSELYEGIASMLEPTSTSHVLDDKDVGSELNGGIESMSEPSVPTKLLGDMDDVDSELSEGTESSLEPGSSTERFDEFEDAGPELYEGIESMFEPTSTTHVLVDKDDVGSELNGGIESMSAPTGTTKLLGDMDDVDSQLSEDTEGSLEPNSTTQLQESSEDDGECPNGEEEFAGLCYTKCEQLAPGYPHRGTPWACCKDNPCQLDAMKQNMSHLVCSGFAVSGINGNGCPHRRGACLENEEMYMSRCYKKCKELTNGEYPFRKAIATCCKKSSFLSCLNPFNYKISAAFNVGGGSGDGDESTPRGSHGPLPLGQSSSDSGSSAHSDLAEKDLPPIIPSVP